MVTVLVFMNVLLGNEKSKLVLSTLNILINIKADFHAAIYSTDIFPG